MLASRSDPTPRTIGNWRWVRFSLGKGPLGVDFVNVRVCPPTAKNDVLHGFVVTEI
jgi:hypothetical protein